jgi:hypothetical protein
MKQQQFTCNQQALGLLQPIAPRGGIDIFFSGPICPINVRSDHDK